MSSSRADDRHDGGATLPRRSHRQLRLAVALHARATLLACLLLASPAAPAVAQTLSPVLAARFSAGVDAFKAGNLPAAEAAFRDVLQAGDAPAFVHHNLGLVLRERGRHADALAQFRAATSRDAAFGPAWLLAGTSLLALDRPGEAATALERAVRLMPTERLALLQLAEAYERDGNLAALTDTSRLVAQRLPNDPEYVYRLGRAYLNLAQWAHAEMRRVHPESARVSQALGREYLQQERSDLALAAFAEAARRDPRLPEVRLALARIHFDEGRFDEAAREVEMALALEPTSQEAHALRSRITAARAR